MSELITNKDVLIDEARNKSSRVTSVLHKIFPSMLKRKVERLAQVKAENERREQLGPDGRIKEDARTSVSMCFTPEIWGNTQTARQEGKYTPLLIYPDSYPSYSRNVSKYLKEAGITGENVLTGLQTPRYAFSFAITEAGQFAADVDNEPEVYLCGISEDESVEVAHKLDDDFFESLSPDDMSLLENVAAERVARTRQMQFFDHTDKYI